ncbi:MAG: hypothetical protein KGO02_02700 [Alphaproteobacteria bacterium]|nr:hypothetical protein [Alphaproteobacteria bacterium]
MFLLAGLLAGIAVHSVLGRSYVAEATISPISRGGASVGGALGLLSAASGGAYGANSDSEFEEYTAVLQSERLAQELERQHGVLRIIFSKQWDKASHSWRKPNSLVGTIKESLGITWSPPDSLALAKWLSKNLNMSPHATPDGGLSVLRSQILNVSLRFRSRQEAVMLLRYILVGADDIVRQNQAANVENRIAYLQRNIKSTTDINLADTLRKLLLDQEGTLMSLKADRFYSVAIIDPPHAPHTPVGISLTKILVLSLGLSLFCAAALVLLVLRRRFDLAYGTNFDPLAEPFPNPILACANVLRRSYAPFSRSRKHDNS